MTLPLRKGRLVELFVSDPWDFGTECGCGPFLATIEEVRSNGLRLRLSAPLDYRGRISFLDAAPRYAATLDADLASGASMSANLGLLYDSPSLETPSGATFVIGTLRLLP